MAELEILNVLVGVLCPTNEAASTCNDFISNHSQILPPVGPVFYFLLFPAVFTILFVMIIMDSVHVIRHNGIKLVFGATAFIFIIISGWYPIMLVLSEFWYIAMILLGLLWFLKGHFGGGSQKTPGGSMHGLGGALGAVMTVKEQRDELKLAEDSLNLAEKRLNLIEGEKETRGPESMQQIEDSLKSATSAINSLLLNPLHSKKALELERKKLHLEKRLANLNK